MSDWLTASIRHKIRNVLMENVNGKRIICSFIEKYKKNCQWHSQFSIQAGRENKLPQNQNKTLIVDSDASTISNTKNIHFKYV